MTYLPKLATRPNEATEIATPYSIMSWLHLLGILFAVALLLGAGVLSGKKVKSAHDFATGGGKAGHWMVCGTIMGTLVGGQTTLGTAQLAFAFGIEAWWFALGSTLGCILLALAYARPLRLSGSTTLLEIIGRRYGHKVELTGSLLSLLSIFISILAQIIAATALISSFFPLSYLGSALTAALLMIGYVVIGGVRGTGVGGLVKLGLLYLSCLVGGIVVWRLSNGYSGIMAMLRSTLGGTALGELRQFATPNDVDICYGNLIARGLPKDVGSALSLTLGVLCTQTYAQGVWMARSHSEARRGTLISALLIPPIGAASILIGLYMRNHYITAEELSALQALGKTIPQGMGVIANSAQAFPMFVMEVLPNSIGGIVLGTLLVTVVGSGSGLSLGAATIVQRDVLRRGGLQLSRSIVVGILSVGVMVSLSVSKGFMNDLGFLSLGLRATAVLIPLCCALWLPHRGNAHTMMASMIVATTTMLIAQIAQLPGDSMFYGLAIGILVASGGLVIEQRQKAK